MNWGGFEIIFGGIIRNTKELGIPLTSEILTVLHIVFYKGNHAKSKYEYLLVFTVSLDVSRILYFGI